jgi:hypothetical protein
MRPGKMYTVEGTTEDISKGITFYPPPTLPPALPQMNAALRSDFQMVAGNPGVLQGTPPPGVNSGVAIGQLQAEAQAPAGLKSQYVEETIYRMTMLCLHDMVNKEEAKHIMRYNAEYPVELVEQYIIPFARQMIWDVDVSLGTGAGTVKAQKDAQIRADFAVAGPDGSPLVDVQTAREALDYDHDEIERRLKYAAEKRAEQQAEIAAKLAPPDQKGPEKLSLTIAFKDLAPSTQAQIVQMMGLEPPQLGEVPTAEVMKAEAMAQKAQQMSQKRPIE